MPNHVTTRIVAPTEVVMALVKPHTDEEKQKHRQEWEEGNVRYKERTGKTWEYPYDPLPDYYVDFEMLIPSPPNKETDACSGEHPEGVICWYRWNVDNWGTKWNAYEAELTQSGTGVDELQFDTAWAHPFPVIEALSAKFPEAIIQVAFADEDLGRNCGFYTIKGGEMSLQSEFPMGSDDAHEFAAQLKYGQSYADLQKEWDE